MSQAWGDVWTCAEEKFGLRSQVQCALDGATLGLNFLLQKSNGINQLLGTRWAAGNVNVHGNDLIYALNQGIIVEDPT